MSYLKLLLIVLTGFVSSGTWSQTKVASKINLQAKDWTVLTVQDQLTIEYKFESCYSSIGYDQNKLLLRLSNTGNTEMMVNWHALLEYDGECKTCAYPQEYSYSVSILPNSSITGDCSLEANIALRYFSRFIDKNYTGKPTNLTGFELFGLTITNPTTK